MSDLDAKVASLEQTVNKLNVEIASILKLVESGESDSSGVKEDVKTLIKELAGLTAKVTAYVDMTSTDRSKVHAELTKIYEKIDELTAKTFATAQLSGELMELKRHMSTLKSTVDKLLTASEMSDNFHDKALETFMGSQSEKCAQHHVDIEKEFKKVNDDLTVVKKECDDLKKLNWQLKGAMGLLTIIGIVLSVVLSSIRINSAIKVAKAEANPTTTVNATIKKIDGEKK